MLTKKPEILSVFFAIGYLLLCVIAKANMVWLIKAGTVMVVTIVKVTDVSSRTTYHYCNYNWSTSYFVFCFFLYNFTL